MASPLQILSVAPLEIHESEIITATWENPAEKFCIHLRTNNNMLKHIKGNTQWLEKKGVWNYHITDADGGLWPVTFFNNNWWLINLVNGKTWSPAD